MKKLTKLLLILPGFSQPIDNPPGLLFSGDKANLGAILSALLEIAFYVAGFLAFFWMVWGAFQYMMAQGKKEELQKARNRITFAVIGLIVVILAYFITRYAAEILPPQGVGGGLPFPTQNP